MNRAEIAHLIKETNGKWFTVVFKKKDNSLRTMNCRINVKKHLRGGISTTKHLSHLVTVWDRVANGYRNINLDTVISFKCGT
jgi:hypothetical protein